MRATLLLGILLSGTAFAFAQGLDYPPGAFNGDCVDVTTFPGVDKTGGLDSSAGIQAAIDAVAANTATPRQRTVYFPDGTYLISKTIAAKTSAGTNLYRFHLVGQSQAGTVIRISGLSTNFASAAGVPMVQTENLGTGGTAFDNCVWNMTLDTGTNNPHAVGIDYTANNTGSVRNVTIQGSGSIGLQMTHAYPGPCLIENVTIDGFATGVALSQAEYCATIENLVLKNQTTVGMSNGSNALFVRGLTSTNSVPAISNSPSGLLVLLDSTAVHTGAATTNAAVANLATAAGIGGVFARNFTSSGYGWAISNAQVTGGANTTTNAPDGAVAEYSSHPVLTPGLAGARTASLNLPIQETPAFADNNVADWYSVASNSVSPNQTAGNDQSAGIQAAIDAAAAAGKTTLYFPPGKYYLTHPIKIHGSIRRILGFGTYLMPSGKSTGVFGAANASNLQPVIVVGDITGAADLAGSLEMDQINVYPTSVAGATYYIGIQHNTSQTLTLRDVQVSSGSAAQVAYTAVAGVGDLFLDDFEASNLYFTVPGQHVWARQLDVEGDTDGVPSDYQAKITNTGALLWVLGLKTEDYGTLVASSGGASTEILGAFAWAVHSPGGTHLQTTLNNNLFDVEDSDFSACYVSNGSPDYPNQVGQTEGTLPGLLYGYGSTNGPSAYPRKQTSTTASMVPLVVAAPAGALAIPGIDIGRVGVAGTAGISGSVYTVQGGGAAIGGTADAFHFCSQSAAGDCTVTARVATLQNTSASAKGGVMIRESTAPGSAMVLCALLHNQVDFVIRSATGASAVVALQSGVTAPYWVQLKRSGNSFTAYGSPDGSAWTQIGLAHAFTMASPALAGLAVGSGTTSALCTATFDNVGVAP